MRFRAGLVAALILALPAAVARAQDTVTTHDVTASDSLRDELERLRRTVDSLRATAERQDERLMELDERTAGTALPAPGAPSVPGDTTGRRTILSARGIRGKPSFARLGSGAAIGGYVDIEYRNDIDGHTSTFDQHRLVPFIFAEITDRLHFGTEIEFEHGAALELEDGKAEGGGEVSVEFATLDYRIAEPLAFRAGVILAPLGRFNLVHDSPINELTDRPLVSTYIEPTTLSEAGFGLFGTVYPGERSLLSYEVYVVNGFTGGIFEEEDGTVRLRVRGGRGLRGEDNNFAKAVVGRVAYSPLLGLELGASAHTGRYAAASDVFTGDERLTIWGLDATWQHRAIELLGEYGRVDANVPAPYRALGVGGRQDGWYVQGVYHFGHGWIPPRETSMLTGVVRWDRVDFAAGSTGDDALDRLTVGVNWRPIPNAVLKSGFQWNWRTPAGSAARDAARKRLVLSAATYF